MDRGEQRVDQHDRLRALFHEVGHAEVPAHMEEKVLAALANAGSTTKDHAPLITVRGWMIVGSLLVAVVLAGSMIQPVHAAPHAHMFDLVSSLRIPLFIEVITSQWMKTAIAAIAVLALLDHAINRRLQDLTI